MNSPCAPSHPSLLIYLITSPLISLYEQTGLELAVFPIGRLQAFFFFFKQGAVREADLLRTRPAWSKLSR